MNTTKQNNVQKAKDNAKKQAAKIEKLKQGACYGAPCFGVGSNCLRCLALEDCAATMQKKVADKAVKAAKAAKQTAKKSVKKAPAKKLGLIDLFAIILINEKMISISDFVNKALIVGNGQNGFPLVGASQICTHLEHLSKNKSIPVLAAGLKVSKTGDYLTVEGFSGHIGGGKLAPMFGMM